MDQITFLLYNNVIVIKFDTEIQSIQVLELLGQSISSWIIYIYYLKYPK